VMMGQRKKEYVNTNEFSLWLRKYNSNLFKTNYVFTGFYRGSGYLVLPNDKQTENNYQVKSVIDAVMFKNAFPYSSRLASIELQGYNSIRSIPDAYLFLQYLPNSLYAQDVRQFIARREAEIAAMQQQERERCRKNDLGQVLQFFVDLAAAGVAFDCTFLGGYKENPKLCKFVSCYIQLRIGNTLDDPAEALALSEIVGAVISRKMPTIAGVSESVLIEILSGAVKDALKADGKEKYIGIVDGIGFLKCYLSN
jgi:hypothetical protein